MTWAQQYRHDWIVEMVMIFGFINREHIVKKFRVSIPQSSADISRVMKKRPYLMAYNAVLKSYRLNQIEEPTP